jgi:two-component system, LytTR family, response regulator
VKREILGAYYSFDSNSARAYIKRQNAKHMPAGSRHSPLKSGSYKTHELALAIPLICITIEADRVMSEPGQTSGNVLWAVMDMRTIVADADPFSRRALCALLNADPEIELLAECASGDEAINSIKEYRPTLMFLDVDLEMNVVSCVRMVQALESGILPTIILTGPPGKLAPGAAEEHPFHLVSPISRGHLAEMLRRAESRSKSQSRLERDVQVRSGMNGERGRIVLKSAGRFVFVRAEEIDWIQAERNYIRVHVGKESIVQRGPISAFEARLDRATFIRIHKSAIVNIDKIKELRPWPTGEYVVLMRNGKELTMSRGYRAQLPFLSKGLDCVDDSRHRASRLLSRDGTRRASLRVLTKQRQREFTVCLDNCPFQQGDPLRVQKTDKILESLVRQP